MRAVVLIFILLILSALCGAVQAESAASARTCAKAKGPNGDEDRAVFTFSLGASDFRVTARGKGSRRGHSPQPRHFILRLPDEYITRLFACQIGDDVLIAAEVSTSDGESGGGYVYRLAGTSLVAQWRQDIPAFNVANPVLDGATAYVSGIGFIAAINLVSGKYRWRYSGFYEGFHEGSDRYNAFEPAAVQGDVVLFQEHGKPGGSEIAVRKQTGEILRPSDLKEKVKTQESREK
jgi:hypothetical protein